MANEDLHKQCECREGKTVTPEMLKKHTSQFATMLGTYSAMTSRLMASVAFTAQAHTEEAGVEPDLAQEILDLISDYDPAIQVETMAFLVHHLLAGMLEHYFDQPEFIQAVLDYGAEARCLTCDRPTPADPEQLKQFMKTTSERVH